MVTIQRSEQFEEVKSQFNGLSVVNLLFDSKKSKKRESEAFSSKLLPD